MLKQDVGRCYLFFTRIKMTASAIRPANKLVKMIANSFICLSLLPPPSLLFRPLFSLCGGMLCVVVMVVGIVVGDGLRVVRGLPLMTEKEF